MVSKSVLALGLFVIVVAILVVDAKPKQKHYVGDHLETIKVMHRVRRAVKNILSHSEVAGKEGKRGGGSGSGESGSGNNKRGQGRKKSESNGNQNKEETTTDE